MPLQATRGRLSLPQPLPEAPGGGARQLSAAPGARSAAVTNGELSCTGKEDAAQAGTNTTKAGLPPEAHSQPSRCTPGLAFGPLDLARLRGSQGARERVGRPGRSGGRLPLPRPACPSIFTTPLGARFHLESGIYQEVEREKKKRSALCVCVLPGVLAPSQRVARLRSGARFLFTFDL